MAVMILALSVMPCMDDKSEGGNKIKTEISKSSNQSGHSGNDECSPFCTCSCCSISFVYQAFSFNYLDKPVFQTKKYSFYKPSFYPEISFSIWQPPKLS